MPKDYNDIHFPGWEVVKKLGEGSFGGVYEIMRTLSDGTVEQSALKRMVVPKDSAEIDELRYRHFDNESITSHFRERMQDLVREYSLMRKLSNSPNVVHCQDVQTIQHSDGIGWDIFIRMELLIPLKQHIADLREKGRYNESEVIRLAVNMCNALQACHQQNIIHRDIKPENILVSPEGEYKLGDFGIAKITEKTATGTLTGTYSYMAPEIFNHQHYGASVDIYSLGMVMYWMLNEQTLPFLPHDRIPTAAQKQEAVDRRFSGETLPEPLHGSRELKKVVLKACAFDPAERYRTVLEFREALRACYYWLQKHPPKKGPTVAAPPVQGKNSEGVLEELGISEELLTDYDNRSSDNGGGNNYPQPITDPAELPAPAPLPPKLPIYIKLVALLAVVAVMAAAAIWGAIFAFSRQNNQNERLTAASAIVYSTLPDAASNFTASQSAVPTVRKAYAQEDDYFWGQNRIKRQEIKKIVFTNESIAGTNAWDISEKYDGSIMAYVDEGVLYVFSDGPIKLNPDSSYLFYRFESVDEIAFNGIVDTSSVENMHEMFHGCISLTNLDVSKWDTGSVKDMGCLFGACVCLSELDVSGWNTSSVETMERMFYSCSNLTQLNLSQWDTSNVTNMAQMFMDCSSLMQVDISNWNTEKVIGMGFMFENCSSLAEIDVSKWNTSNVVDMTGMFENCSNLKQLDISNWDISNAFNEGMFEGCSAYQKLIF